MRQSFVFVASLQTAKQLPPAAAVVAPAAGRSARVRPRDLFTYFVASLQTAKQLPPAAAVVAPAAGRSARVRPRDLFTYLSLRSKPPSNFLRPQLFLLLLQAASTPSRQKRARRGPRSRRVFGLATCSLICRSRTGPTTQLDDPGTKLLADIIRGQPACAVSRHQKVACQL